MRKQVHKLKICKSIFQLQCQISTLWKLKGNHAFHKCKASAAECSEWIIQVKERRSTRGKKGHSGTVMCVYSYVCFWGGQALTVDSMVLWWQDTGSDCSLSSPSSSSTMWHSVPKPSSHLQSGPFLPVGPQSQQKHTHEK